MKLIPKNKNHKKFNKYYLTISFLGLSACGSGNDSSNSNPTAPAPPAPLTNDNFNETSSNVFVVTDPATNAVLNHPNVTENLSVTGGDGQDTIRTGSGDDTINGGDGHDDISGGAGADTLNGGAGNDTLDYRGQNPSGGVNINLAANTASGGNAEGDIISGFENVDGTQYDDNITGSSESNALLGGFGNDTINGNSGNDLLVGDAGDDTLNGGSGDDEMYGGAGIDFLDGGPGNDTIFFGELDSQNTRYNYGGTVDTGVNVNLETQTATGGHADGDTFINFESAVGTEHADVLTGTSGENTLIGRGGDDIINAGDGNDTIYGDIRLNNAPDWDEYRGDDTINAGAGDDFVVGGEGVDLINGGDGDDRIFGDDGYQLETTADGADTINGGNGNDEIFGGYHNDILNGNDGDDTIDGGHGADIIDGGAGDDTIKTQFSENGILIDQIDGGTGTDTLFIDNSDPESYDNFGPQTIDLSSVNAINIEIIHIELPNTLNLTVQDVIDVTDANNQLIINSINSQTINSTGQGWVQGADQVVDFNNYNTYTNGTATLLIDDDLTQTIS